MKKFLPLGTVVTLKEGKKRLMIVGRLQNQVGKNIVYDYSNRIEQTNAELLSDLYSDEVVASNYLAGTSDITSFVIAMYKFHLSI